MPQTAFYGRVKYLTLPYAGYSEILKYAEVNCAGYLLLYDRKDKVLRPLLESLMKDNFSDDRLKLLKRIEVSGGKIYLYEFAEKRSCSKNAH